MFKWFKWNDALLLPEIEPIYMLSTTVQYTGLLYLSG